MSSQKTWKDYGLDLEKTGDGSPSLRLKPEKSDSIVRPESMHHSGGAASETQMIYDPVAHWVWDHVQKPNFIVVGLGLGYIEFSLGLQALRRFKGFSRELGIGSLVSFESEEFLRDALKSWLFGSRVYSGEIESTYDEIIRSLGASMEEEKLLSKLMRDWLDQGQWIIKGTLNDKSYREVPEGSINGIFYDPYSSKTTEGLWKEDFLKSFINHLSSKQAVALSTYSCSGSLKRALQSQNFQIEKRTGFKSKKNQIWAQRHRP